MSEKTYKGSGLKFPVTIDSTGKFKISSEEEKIKEAIHLILMTHKGERQMLPTFGSELNKYVFTNTDATTLNLMGNSIKKNILKHEKRIEDVQINIATDKQQPGKLYANINYRVAHSNLTGNMVFPFYIQGGTEGDVDESK
ncbi:MAG: GPW/gp25 family protein [Oscillospiraceae bacterium]|nr:GPW/gp25 family protein [Oscillospiraceae bacterium]